MVKKINVHTDPTGLKMLRTKCMPVLGITDDLQMHINDLAETCNADPNCIGLSSNQIWDNIIDPPPAVFVIKMQDGIMPFINPGLVKVFKKVDVMREGCMSAPGKFCNIERPKHIVISFMDTEGKKLDNHHLYYLPARIWLHEYDHIQGKLITDYE
jgi:peptide deformylase